MESILNSVKASCQIPTEELSFDPILIMHTNRVFSTLAQMGVGAPEGFSIQDAYPVWTDYLEEGLLLGFVRTYVGDKVHLLFDPPQNSSHLQALKDNIAEMEFRISIEVNPGSTTI